MGRPVPGSLVVIIQGNSCDRTSAKMSEKELDLINRDPNAINTHLECRFEDVLAEPDGTHSIDCVWKLSYSCFNLWKKICYLIMTTCCGICIAAEWGCEFAWVSFVHIWYITPCFKWLDINCGCMRKLCTSCISCCLDPICMSLGLFFHQFEKQ